MTDNTEYLANVLREIVERAKAGLADPTNINAMAEAVDEVRALGDAGNKALIDAYRKSLSKSVHGRSDAATATTATTQIEAGTRWIKIISLDDLPKKPGLRSYEQIDCLIVYRGEVLRRVWNCEHFVWDGEDGDDFFCGPLEPTHYMAIPPVFVT